MDIEKISSIMSRDIISLKPTEALKSAVQKMCFNNVSCVIVVEGKKPVGIFTQRDIVYLIGNNIDFDSAILESLMRSPVIAVPEDLEIPEAANLMVINNLRRLVVVDNEQNVMGIVTQTDIIKNLRIDSFINLKKVNQIMRYSIISTGRENSLSTVISLMANHRVSCVPVIENGKPVGLITESDITKAIAENKISCIAEEIMSPSVLTALGDKNLYEATRLMDDNKTRSLLIIDEKNNAIGIITKSDIIKNLRADYIGVLKNMLKQKSRALIESELKYRTLVEQSLEGIMIIKEGLIKFVNKTLLKILNYEEEDMIGKEILRFLHPQSRDLLSENFLKLNSNQNIESSIELKMINQTGDGIHIEGLLNRINYEGSTGVLITLRDITERKKAEAELKRLVITDDLTGLYNQRFFYNQLNKEIERAKRHNRPLSILLIDIDLFKDFNDKYGHWEGDFVLKKLGEILTKNIRDIDMAFRYGGEEFAVILPDTKYVDALIVAERIRKSVAQTVFYPFTLDGQPDVVSKTVSIGATEFHAEDNMKSFLKRVDNAMYQAKKHGRNKVVHLA